MGRKARHTDYSWLFVSRLKDHLQKSTTGWAHLSGDRLNVSPWSPLGELRDFALSVLTAFDAYIVATPVYCAVVYFPCFPVCPQYSRPCFWKPERFLCLCQATLHILIHVSGCDTQLLTKQTKKWLSKEMLVLSDGLCVLLTETTLLAVKTVPVLCRGSGEQLGVGVEN